MATETFIENNLIRNRERLFGVPDSLFIRRSRIGRGFGIADLIILPERGPRRLIIVEAKRSLSEDAKIEVVGQLLMYYGGALELGTHGLRLLRRFAVEHPRATRSPRPKSLKSLTAGVSPPDRAWAELRKGRRLRPNQIGLVAALDDRPGPTMKQALSILLEHHGLNITVVSVLGPNQLEVWQPH